MDIGDIHQSNNKKVKVLMYNSGPRASFVHVTCQELDGHASLPESRAHVSPSTLVIAAHSTGEVSLYYRPMKAEVGGCVKSGVPLARLVIQNGDECIRQKLMASMEEDAGRKGSGSGAIEKFLKDLPSQDEVESGGGWSCFFIVFFIVVVLLLFLFCFYLCMYNV